MSTGSLILRHAPLAPLARLALFAPTRFHVQQSLPCQVGEVVVSQNEGTQNRPQYIKILIIGTPKMLPLVLGNPEV